MTCATCGKGKLVSRRENHKYTESGLPNVTLVGVEKLTCPECGEEELVLPRVEELHRLIAQIVISKAARPTKEEIRFLRKQLGWSGSDFAKHMGVTVETVSRWENGKKDMGPSADRLLRLMVAHYTPVECYPIDTLARVDETAGPRPVRMRMRSSAHGWSYEGSPT